MLSERDLGKLNLIIEYCEFIQKILLNVNNDFNIFENDFEAQQSISFDILQIGESINKLSDEIKNKYKEISWHKIIGMRNIIAHEYGAMDVSILFESASNNIPELEQYCTRIIDLETKTQNN